MDKDPGELQGLKLKLGLDLHGVIDSDPVFFSDLACMLLDMGSQVYVVTGREETEELHDELRQCGMERGDERDGTNIEIYSDILSITTYQKRQGVPVHYLDEDLTQPMMDPTIWNPTKAALCASAGIHLMIDDSTIYEPFFQEIKTQYIVYTPEIKEFLKILFYFGGYKL